MTGEKRFHSRDLLFWMMDARWRVSWSWVLLFVVIYSERWIVNSEPMYFTYEALEKIPHDASSFVEGLVFRDDDSIVESVGLVGHSKLLLYKSVYSETPEASEDSATEQTVTKDQGNVLLASTENKGSEFAEGIVFLKRDHELFPSVEVDEVLVQLTYKKHNIHFYALTADDSDWEVVGDAKLPQMIKEGWGLTTTSDERHLIMSDGSPVLYYLQISKEKVPGDGDRLVIEIGDTLTVHDCFNAFSKVHGLNELEVVPSSQLPVVSNQRRPSILMPDPFSQGSPTARQEVASTHHVWANIIGTWCIAVIDLGQSKTSEKGQVVAWINLQGIDPAFDRFNKVANGIAYRFSDDSLWITGKKWAHLYRIQLKQTQPFDAKATCTSPWSSTRTEKAVDLCD